MRDKAYHAVMVLLAFAAALLLALMLAVAVRPDCLESAYLYSLPDISMAQKEMMVKTPDPFTLKKERWYLQRIEEARHAKAVR